MENIYLFNIKNNEIENINKDDSMEKIYFLEYRLPTSKEIDEHMDKNTFNKFNLNKSSDIHNKIKYTLSKIENKVPLYDAYTENIYLINRHNVYNRVMHQHYRFPDKDLIDEIKDKKNKHRGNKNDVIKDRKNRKVNLMIDFMNNFDADILYDTYVKVFYKYSEHVGKENTVCKNISFLSQFHHMKPYLTRSEIINLALNFDIDIPKDKYLEQDDIMGLCKKIKKFQIDSEVLLQHQIYIIENGNMGLVQYYTLQGSHFMNQYLRGLTKYISKNDYLENLITPMWNLVNNAPEFDKSYIVYRFIQDDNFLNNLKTGEIYTEKGFMSTTRDPFYRSDLYKFGFILMKIKIPSNRKGVALCLETVSHFPDEQEIIFPPNSKFKLLKIDEECSYYHTEPHYSSKIKTRYEFEWIDNSEISFEKKKEQKTQYEYIDFLKIKKHASYSLEEKIKFFELNHVNEMYQFKIKLGDNDFTVVAEWYDSTSAYSDFYALNVQNGYSFYTMYKGFLLFFIELGTTDNGNQMHVNYYVKYSSIDSNKIIGDENIMKFFSSIAHYFDMSSIIIYASYMNCNNTICEQKGGASQRGFSVHKSVSKKENTLELMNGSYCVDFYEYFKNNKKKYLNFGLLNVELQPLFSYYDLDILKNSSPSKILKKDDRDELYQLYVKIFKKNKSDTISEFYLWLKEHKCYLIDQFVNKLDRLEEIKNPFKNDMYVLDASTYLYNRKYINTYPAYININNDVKRNIIKDNKHEMRKKPSR
jgi:hypothetical protein